MELYNLLHMELYNLLHNNWYEKLNKGTVPEETHGILQE